MAAIVALLATRDPRPATRGLLATSSRPGSALNTVCLNDKFSFGICW